jgi:hypothetical protein
VAKQTWRNSERACWRRQFSRREEGFVVYLYIWFVLFYKDGSLISEPRQSEVASGAQKNCPRNVPALLLLFVVVLLLYSSAAVIPLFSGDDCCQSTMMTPKRSRFAKKNVFLFLPPPFPSVPSQRRRPFVYRDSVGSRNAPKAVTCIKARASLSLSFPCYEPPRTFSPREIPPKKSPNPAQPP